MRLVVGLLACVAATALSSALADPPAEAPPAAAQAPQGPAAPPNATAPQAAAVQAAAAKEAANPAAAAKPAVDMDMQHLLAEGYKPEMHNGEQIYCRKETALGSRLTQVKNCGTIEQLKVAEQRVKAGVFDAQRQQVNPTYH